MSKLKPTSNLKWVIFNEEKTLVQLWSDNKFNIEWRPIMTEVVTKSPFNLKTTKKDIDR